MSAVLTAAAVASGLAALLFLAATMHRAIDVFDDRSPWVIGAACVVATFLAVLAGSLV